MTAIIAAMARNRVIGRAGGLPWHLPADLRRFKAITMGHTLVMGRTTYESIGRPLPGRRTIVVTRQPGWMMPGVDVARSVDEALEMQGASDMFIAGGGDVYRQTLDRVDRLYLTCLGRDVEGDTYFPPFDRAAFTVVAEEAHADEPLPFTFLTLERNR